MKKDSQLILNKIQNFNCTCTIAGSCGRVWWDFGGSHTCKSFISLALKIIYSYTSSLGATGLSVGLPSVPNERTEMRKKSDKLYSLD